MNIFELPSNDLATKLEDTTDHYDRATAVLKEIKSHLYTMEEKGKTDEDVEKAVHMQYLADSVHHSLNCFKEDIYKVVNPLYSLERKIERMKEEESLRRKQNRKKAGDLEAAS